MKKLLLILILLICMSPVVSAYSNDTIPPKQKLNEKLVLEDQQQKSMSSSSITFIPVDNISQSLILNTTNQTPLENLVDPIRWEPYFVTSLIFLVLGMLFERKFHWIGFFSGIICLTFFITTNTVITGNILVILIMLIITLISVNGFLIHEKGKGH
jgi:hypothetical protein